ncbi:Tetratricopeptide repeat-containing protein [Dokdonella immobilis]|uniref:Tetratricopeptide repeat-containing protein n=2 Tax=Dokdonella immobilis TaxID=578942 RepID=A0A1I4YES3_9GAMM|nr:Tetratricopeptide repeat-containing protein [Dokdonella immobilis]
MAGTALAAALLVLSACASSPKRPRVVEVQRQSVAPVPREKDLPLMLIGAEYALQKNDLAAAAQGYVDAAGLSPDPAIAEQATRLALAVKQWPLAKTALQRWQALDPKAVGVRQASAWIALAEGEVERAYAELVALAERPDKGRWRPVAQVLLGAADKSQASNLLARLATPERLGDQDLDWVAMSQLAFKLDDKALAERLSAETLRRFKTADDYAWSAQLALDRGEKEAARARYAEALKRDPESLRLRTGYAALLAEAGDNAGAARALDAGKQTDVVYGARAAYAARADDKPLLGKLYSDMQSDSSPRSGKRLYLLGQVAELIGKDKQAADWYRQVPEDDERWFDAGIRTVVLIDKQGDAEAALRKINELRLAVGTDSRETVDLYLLEADLLSRKAKKREAIAVYTRGLEQLHDEPRLLYARAMLYIEIDDIDAGERDLRALLATDPDSADALNALGYTLADRTDRYAEANALIEKAIKIKPDEPAIIDSYGWVQYRLGNLDEAVRLLRKAFEKQPDSEVAAHLGEVLWVRGDREEARQVWEQGRKKDAENKVLIETMKRLAS